MYAINIIKNERGRDIETTENASTEVQLKKKQNKTAPSPKPPQKSSPKESEKGRALPSYYLADSSSWQKIYKIICIFNTDNCEELS